MVEEVCVGLGYFACIFCNVKDVVCIRCGVFPLHIFRNIVKNFSNLVNHQEYTYNPLREIGRASYIKQCTILWHANDLNTSHVDPAVISSFLA